jgi:uncharacterized protein HemY
VFDIIDVQCNHEDYLFLAFIIILIILVCILKILELMQNYTRKLTHTIGWNENMKRKKIVLSVSWDIKYLTWLIA